MIQDISSYEDCREFISGFQGDPLFSDPMLSTQEMLDCNLIKAFTRPNRRILGVYDAQLAGLFVLLTLPEEKYLEMLVGLSREKQVYAELLTFLKQEYSGWNGDFVFNPRNVILKETLQDENAAFEQEQQRMVFSGQLLPVNTDEIHAFSEQYFAEYCAIHGKDMYWTGEKIAAAPEKFRTFLAINQGCVVGYLDVTHCFEENEPYDVYVLPEYRRRGYGRKLLVKALECNQPKGMMLLVETDNTAAIRLYESMNFKTVPGQNSLTAHWRIPEEKEIDFEKEMRYS